MCERCELTNPNNPVTCGAKEVPDRPVEIVHGYLILYPDLMEPFTFYPFKWQGMKLKVWKTICAIEILEQDGPGLVLEFKPAKLLLGKEMLIGDFMVGKPSLGVISIMRVNENDICEASERD